MNAKNKHETFRVLRVAIPDDQRLELGKQLAQAHNETATIEGDLQRVKDEFKSKLSAVSARITDLSNKVSTGYEVKDVLCLWTMDSPKPGKKALARMDGPDDLPREIIEIVDMTEAEKTPELALNLDNPVLPSGVSIAGDGSVKVASDGPAEPGEGKK